MKPWRDIDFKNFFSPEILRYIHAELVVFWLAAFAFQACSIAWWASRLTKTTEGLEETSRALELQARETTHLTKSIKAESQDLEFLQGLPNLLPQDKGYLRTQRVIAEEVEKLRLQIARRLKGSLQVIVDAKANKLYLKQGLSILWQADCSVGRGGLLEDKKTGRRWQFVTPRGEFRILGKRENPAWLKPDWAFVEAKEPIPPPDDPKRKVPGELGAYVLNLGDGYLIHGTKNENTLGRAVSHGCVRLGAADLKKLYEAVPVNTRVFIIY